MFKILSQKKWVIIYIKNEVLTSDFNLFKNQVQKTK